MESKKKYFVQCNIEHLFNRSTKPVYASYIASTTVSPTELTLYSHSVTELMFVTEGYIKVQVEDDVYTMRQGDVIIINAHTKHGEFSDTLNSGRYYIVGIPNIQFAQNISMGISKPKSAGADSSIGHTLHRFFHESADETAAGREYIVNCLFDILMADITRLYQTEPLTLERKSVSDLIDQVEKYISENHQANLSLDALAKMFFCSPKTLSRNFSRIIGMPISEFIIKKRVEDGMLNLNISSLSVSRIANLAGFSSPAYFALQFKRHTGMTPSEYRKSTANVKQAVPSYLSDT